MNKTLYIVYPFQSQNQWRIQECCLGSAEPPILSFCAHDASPASCARTSAVKTFLDSGKPPFQNPRSATENVVNLHTSRNVNKTRTIVNFDPVGRQHFGIISCYSPLMYILGSPSSLQPLLHRRERERTMCLWV